MCNFIPGEVIAIGQHSILHDLGNNLPGIKGEVRPLITEIGQVPQDSELIKYSTVTLKTDPGLELFALSKLSARLATAIEKNEAVVDLNHRIPLSAPATDLDFVPRLSPYAEKEILALRRMLRSSLKIPPTPLRVAILDSGLASNFIANRKISFFDYSMGGKLTLDIPQTDPLGHGTRVATILDQILPQEVELCVGKLPSEEGALTALTIAHSLGDIVARQLPDVVNLSVAPRNDWYVCPHCRQRVATPTFLSTFFSLIVRLSAKTFSKTITVMAAGNTGQIPNSRWLNQENENLLFAIAENQKGERTRYSSAPEGPLADLFSASAFGGDDPNPDDPKTQGVFLDGTHGTSFAAPFVTTAALLTKQVTEIPGSRKLSGLGEITSQIISMARQGHTLSLYEIEKMLISVNNKGSDPLIPNQSVINK